MDTKIRSLQLINQLVSLIAIIYVCSIGQYQWLLLAFIFWFVYAPLNVGMTLHRLLTHRSFETYPWLEKFLSVLSVLSTVGPTINWVAVHRLHHVTSDTSDDPHTPYVDGKFNLKAALRVWFGYEWKVKAIPTSYIKDLMRNPVHRWIFNNYFKIIFAWILILLLISPMVLLFAYIVPSALALHSTSAVNVLAHKHGYRNYNTRDKSTNSWIANILSFGEGWHNNHHARPGRSYLKDNWWEWDIIGLMIKGIKK